MKSEIIWGKWYTPSIRIVCHIVFWGLVFFLYYITFKRLGGNYMWFFVAKELFVTATLFYTGIWIISKQVTKGKIIPLLSFIFFSYLWWLNITYLVCEILDHIIPESDVSIYKYVQFFIKDGYLGIYELRKFPRAFPDFLLLISIPLTPKLMKLLIEETNKILYLENNKVLLELERTNLERNNLKMELEILKSQVSPHFLFNTLNSIYWLAEKGEPNTSQTIMQLSNMLRYMLYQTNDDKIFLAKEIQFLQDYLNLVKVRFGESVQIKVTIANSNDPYRIVPLILLPFIENAIKHGPERSRLEAWIDISLTLDNGILKLFLANGVNKNSRKPEKGGIGLQNARRRLDLRYKDKYSLEIFDESSRYTVCLKIEL